MSLLFKLDDGGCWASSHAHERSDCTVSAFAIVTGRPYDLIHSTLALAGRRPNRGFESDVWLKRVRGRVLGGLFKRANVRLPSEVGGPKVTLTPATFSLAYPEGRYLLESPTHVWACCEGVHHDIALPYDRPLTGAWRWHPTPDKEA